MEVVRNAGQVSQPKSFRNLQFGGGKMPTDLDAYYDDENRSWVVIELKHHDKQMSVGQWLAFTRLCQDLSMVKPTLGLLASHNQTEGEVIDCGNATVVRLWYEGRWLTTRAGKTVKEVMDRWVANVVKREE